MTEIWCEVKFVYFLCLDYAFVDILSLTLLHLSSTAVWSNQRKGRQWPCKGFKTACKWLWKRNGSLTWVANNSPWCQSACRSCATLMNWTWAWTRSKLSLTLLLNSNPSVFWIYTATMWVSLNSCFSMLGTSFCPFLSPSRQTIHCQRDI